MKPLLSIGPLHNGPKSIKNTFEGIYWFCCRWKAFLRLLFLLIKQDKTGPQLKTFEIISPSACFPSFVTFNISPFTPLFILTMKISYFLSPKLRFFVVRTFLLRSFHQHSLLKNKIVLKYVRVRKGLFCPLFEDMRSELACFGFYFEVDATFFILYRENVWYFGRFETLQGGIVLNKYGLFQHKRGWVTEKPLWKLNDSTYLWRWDFIFQFLDHEEL